MQAASGAGPGAGNSYGLNQAGQQMIGQRSSDIGTTQAANDNYLKPETPQTRKRRLRLAKLEEDK